MEGTARARRFDDTSRLAALADYRVLDTAAEESFDNLTELAAKLFDTPISLVSLIDEQRQWFKSHHGLAARETPREYAFCEHAIRADETLLVTDTWTDERFAKNPLVLGDPHIRFYCGVPLRSPDGHGLGTLCIIDRQPRQLDDRQLSLLRSLARQVELELEIRRRVVLLEERLESAATAATSREQLATMIVHDMRGPLTTITVLASMVDPANADSQVNLDMLLSEAERLRNMLMNILDVCLHDVGGMRPRCRTFDLRALAVEIAQRYTRTIVKDATSVSVEGTKPVWVQADPELVTRILDNLVGNAVAHASTSPQITIGVWNERSGRVTCEVRDRGVSIDEATRATLFDLWTRGGQSAHRGYGLGLAFCRLAVEAHGGSIDVRSNPEGVGNTFFFDLPAPEPAAS